MCDGQRFVTIDQHHSNHSSDISIEIHGSVLNWFKSYLSSRSFRVKFDNYITAFLLACGVPQGSVLTVHHVYRHSQYLHLIFITD